MSQIPQPVIKTTSTLTSKIPGGGSRTITTTRIRELQPCSAGNQNRSQAPGCQPCPSQSRQRSIQQPRQIGSVSRIARRGTLQPQAPPSSTGQYNMPAERRGVYSGSAGLRSQMGRNQSRGSNLQNATPCPAGGARDRTALPGTTRAPKFAGQRSVYGGPIAGQESTDRSALNERMNQQAAEKLFNMSSREVPRVEEKATEELLHRSMIDPDERVFSKSKFIQQVCKPPMIETPAGMEPIIQQTYTEKRVERDDVAEKVVKNLAVTDIDQKTGRGSRVTISEQQLDPDYGLSSEGKDVITVKETVSITRQYTSTAKDVVHEVIKPRLDINPNELAKLVDEENQDVENTLRMVPPDLALQEDRYTAKKRLQKLRLHSESLMLLEESVVNPTPTADVALTETSPEALASILHTVESGVSPECAPDQVFHTLFEEKSTEHSVILSSVGPGPLQDIVVPQVLTKAIHKESMTPDLTDLTNIYKNVTDAQDWPPVDIFASVMDDEAKSPKKDKKSRPFKPLQDEEMPWADEDLEPLVNIVGGEPTVVLDPANVPDLETSGNLETELTHGIEYFVEADPVQYMSRVQLRGSQPPPWFPGYIFALPEFPDVVKIARNPDEVFVSSWRSCQPKIIPDNSISVLH